ncbi:MAG TPA: CHAD domain-containing protein [Pseudonocardiaceae bacterium]|jgi:CHAD domain-containing protein
MTTIIDETTRMTPIDLDSDSTAGAAVTAYLREHLHRLRAAELAVRTAEPGGVHDMRVAVRRLRSTLRAFRALYGKAQRNRARQLGGELKWLSDTLGAARDAEVIGRQLAAEIAATPSELVLGPVSSVVDRHLARTEATARTDLLSAVDHPRYADLLSGLDAFVASPPANGKGGKRGAKVLPPLVAKAYRRANRAARRAGETTGTERDDALHQVRKAVKRMRYAAEATAPVVGRPAERYRRRSTKVQQVLGDHHDFVVLRATLRDLGVQAHLDGTNSFTFGLLHGRIGMAAIQREREFPQLWHKLASRKARRWQLG